MQSGEVETTPWGVTGASGAEKGEEGQPCEKARQVGMTG